MSPRHIVLGTSASIALHRALDLASEWRKHGHRTSIVMTPNATKLVAPQMFQAVALERVYWDMWAMSDDFDHDHIRLAQDGDVLVVAPATASTIGKLANGILDNILTTTAAAFDGPRLIAPAMNWRMWSNSAVQRNVATLEGDGYEIIPPDDGDLACGERGAGRLATVETIVERVAARLANVDADEVS